MTAYFDRKGSELHEAFADDSEDRESYVVSQELERIELEMVRDVSLAAELPGCPASIRRSIHAAIRKYGVVSQPGNSYWSCVDSNEEWRDRLGCMANDLHDAFHALAYSAPHRTDNPLRPLLTALGHGEEFRSRLDTTIDEDAYQPEGEPSSPWESIVEIIEARGMSVDDFCSRVGIEASTFGTDALDIDVILRGSNYIEFDDAFAQRVADVLGPNAEFWIAREKNYMHDLLRNHEQRAKLADIADYLTNVADDPDLPRSVRRSMKRYADVLRPKGQ